MLASKQKWLDRKGVRIAIISLVIVLPIVSFLITYNRSSSQGGQTPVFKRMDQKIAIPTEVVREIRISGFIEPINSVAVLAPFDSVIEKTLTKVGDMVEKGQTLAILDMTMIDENYRKAQSEFIKAKIAYDRLKGWDAGSQMLKARRSVEEAKNALNKANRDVIETKSLYDKGIIPRMEYDAALQEQIARNNAVASAEDELRTTEQEGNIEHLEMARLEFLNAETRLRTIEADRGNAQVKAPIAGIVTEPPRTEASNSDAATMAAGKRLQKGAPIYNVSDIDSFMVVGEVDEMDINLIHVGQPVTIQSEALPEFIFEGNIISVSAEAIKVSNYAPSPKFKIHAAFKVSDDVERQRLRLGMSAKMLIQIAPAYNGIIVPLHFVRDAATQPKIYIRRDGVSMMVDVELGITTPKGIEIVKGLLKTDELLN